jgi:hypothetical protein
VTFLETWFLQDFGIDEEKLLQNIEQAKDTSGVNRLLDDAMILIEEFLNMV